MRSPSRIRRWGHSKGGWWLSAPVAALVGTCLGVCAALASRHWEPARHSTRHGTLEPDSQHPNTPKRRLTGQLRPTSPPSSGAGASDASSAAPGGGWNVQNPPAPDAGMPDAEPPRPAAAPEQAYPGLSSRSLAEQKDALVLEMVDALRLDASQADRVRTLFRASQWLGQGNPRITAHPMSRAECRAAREKSLGLPSGDASCGAANMVALYDPNRGETAADARLCIDQYEFPNIPCEYPIIWVRANEAVELCRAVGKRICDAHEWEGACAGALRAPSEEYAFGERRMMMEYLHNQKRDVLWAYGTKADPSRCATLSKKSRQCDIIDWGLCGSNTYPAGAFPECRSRFGVFDQHGNVAEHMNLPISPEQLGSRGGLGETEMKGSWFIFARYAAHPDDCRWRAPMWHASLMSEANSHRNYHLGFRCCRDIPGRAPSSLDARDSD